MRVDIADAYPVESILLHETQYFDIAILPAGEARPLVLQFNHALYAD